MNLAVGLAIGGAISMVEEVAIGLSRMVLVQQTDKLSEVLDR